MNIKDRFFTYISKRPGVANLVQQGGISFNFDLNSLHYYFYYDAANDPYYFRIMLPIVDNVTIENKNSILEKCSIISTEFKVGKTIVFNEQVWFSTEVFIYDAGEGLSLLFDRMITILQLMFERYRAINDK